MLADSDFEFPGRSRSQYRLAENRRKATIREFELPEVVVFWSRSDDRLITDAIADVQWDRRGEPGPFDTSSLSV